MLKTTGILAVVLALCCAQEGPRLEIPETFEARFDSIASNRGGTPHMGKGTWYRSESMEADRRTDIFTNATGSFTFEHLMLFKESMEYRIEGTRCEGRPIPEGFKFPMIWRDFEEHGHYGGEKTETVGNTTVQVDVWYMQERDEHVELWAKPPVAPAEEIKEPFAMKRIGHQGEFATIFTSFIAEEPSSTYFVVPESCKMATDNKTPSRPQRPTGDNTRPQGPTGGRPQGPTGDNTRPQGPTGGRPQGPTGDNTRPQGPTGDNTRPQRPTGDTRPQRPQNPMDN